MLENATKGKKLNIKLLVLKKLLDKSLGAIAKSPSEALLIETRLGIHTFFVKRPLDIIVLDNNGKIVKMKEDLRPNNLFFWNPKYRYILELPSGSIKTLSLELGNILRFDL